MADMVVPSLILASIFRAQVKGAMCLNAGRFAGIHKRIERISAGWAECQEAINIRVGGIKVADGGLGLGSIFTFHAQHFASILFLEGVHKTFTANIQTGMANLVVDTNPSFYAGGDHPGAL